MDALIALTLLAVLLAAPCFVQLVLWTGYTLLLGAHAVASRLNTFSRRFTPRLA